MKDAGDGGRLVGDEELDRILEETAAEHNVPEAAVKEIYEAQKEVVNMERRGSILKDMRQILEEYVDEWDSGDQ